MKCEQEKLLYKIQALDFTLLDLSLYLDTHPDDSDAIDYYRTTLAESEMLTCDYERLYGPITQRGCGLNSEKWSWATCPWPWENKDKYKGACHVDL